MCLARVVVLHHKKRDAVNVFLVIAHVGVEARLKFVFPLFILPSPCTSVGITASKLQYTFVGQYLFHLAFEILTFFI